MSRRSKTRLAASPRRRYLRFAFIFFCLLPLLVASLLQTLLTRDRAVAFIEDRWNCRVSLDALQVHAFQYPMKVELKGFSLSPRDNIANAKLPYAQRSPAQVRTLEVEHIALELPHFKTLFRHIELKTLKLTGVSLHYRLDDQGNDNFSELFRSIRAPKVKQLDDAELVHEPKDHRQPKKALSLDDLNWGLSLKSLEINDLQASFDFLEPGIRLQLNNASINVDQIHIDPKELLENNHSTLKWQGELVAEDLERPELVYAKMGINAVAKATIFDPQSRLFAPNLDAEWHLSENSRIYAAFPFFQAAWNELSILRVFGIDPGPIPNELRFVESNYRLKYHQNLLSLQSPLGIDWGGWQLRLNPPLSLQLDQNEHEAHWQLRSAASLSQALLTKVFELSENAPTALRKSFQEEVQQEWVQDQQLCLRLYSHGGIKSPKVKILNQMPDTKKLLKEEGKNLFKNLLNEVK